ADDESVIQHRRRRVAARSGSASTSHAAGVGMTLITPEPGVKAPGNNWTVTPGGGGKGGISHNATRKDVVLLVCRLTLRGV
ncbi:MAG: hypothetical protein V3R95_01345, partial [Dehalococcoidia bacterium]